MSNEMVENPPHYTRIKETLGVETADVIEALGLDWHLGNAFKYLWRAGHKDPAKTLEDIKKARWYLDRYIKANDPMKW